jgi:two-component system phosphate regulon response regulator PhoB
LSQTIFVLEDDADISRLVQHHLEAAGFGARVYANPSNVIADAERQPPSLFLLDIMVPGGDGLDVCRRLRNHAALSTVPIIFLTARASENDRVLGLELGADDYITKPFGMRELVARIRAVLRRTGHDVSADEIVRVGDVTIDKGTHEVHVKDRAVSLTRSEFDLLAFLMASPGRVYSRMDLLERLQGTTFEGVARTIDVHIRNLRTKIEEDPSHPRYIETVFGVGYRFHPEPA